MEARHSRPGIGSVFDKSLIFHDFDALDEKFVGFFPSISGAGLPKDEKHCAHHTKAGPQIVQMDLLLHVEEREKNEDHERNHFLDNLQLRERKVFRTDAIRRYLQAVFEESDEPARANDQNQ